MYKYKYFLFDFNGTLLDDLDMNIEIEKLLLSRRNIIADTSKAYYLENFGFPIIDYYTLLGFDFEKDDFSAVAVEYAEEYESRLKSVSLFEDVIPTLEKLCSEETRCVIISATEHNTLTTQAEIFGLTSYFDAILGTDNNLGKGKVESALSWFSQCGIDPADAVFVGDTVHDFETAKALGCSCILVARGHNSERRLKATGCPVCKSFSELFESISD